MTHSLQAGRFGSFPLPQRKTPVAIATCTEWKMVQKFQRKSFWVCFDGTVRIVPFSKRRRCGSRRGRQGARWAALSGQKVPLRGSLASGSEPRGRAPAGPSLQTTPPRARVPAPARPLRACWSPGTPAFTRPFPRQVRMLVSPGGSCGSFPGNQNQSSDLTFKTKKEN